MRISDWSSDVCSSDLPDPERPQREFVGQQVSLDRRRIAVLAFKGIGEPLCQRRQGRLARIDIYRTSAHMKKLPQVVDAVTMIGMVMRVDDCVDPPDVGCKQLLPQVGAGIEADPGSAGLHPYCRPGLPVPGGRRVTNAPVD